MLPFLMQQFLGKGGNLVQKKVEKLSELSDYDVIVNCAGLAARNLTNDKDVYAIRGQICRVKLQNITSIISTQNYLSNLL